MFEAGQTVPSKTEPVHAKFPKRELFTTR